jgi:glutamate racemase
MIPEDISLIDTGAAVARQLQRLLAERELLAQGPASAAQFWTSSDPEHFRNILPILWNSSGVVRSFEQ